MERVNIPSKGRTSKIRLAVALTGVLGAGSLVFRMGGGPIVGTRRAVCFQDVPLLALAQNIRFEQERGQLALIRRCFGREHSS